MAAHEPFFKVLNHTYELEHHMQTIRDEIKTFKRLTYTQEIVRQKQYEISVFDLADISKFRATDREKRKKSVMYGMSYPSLDSLKTHYQYL